MLQKILNELQREGIKALEYADDFMRQAKKAEVMGNAEEAGRLRLRGHAHRDTAHSLAWVYSRTMEGACTYDVIDLWNNIRRCRTPLELAKLCGIGFAKNSEEEE